MLFSTKRVVQNAVCACTGTLEHVASLFFWAALLCIVENQVSVAAWQLTLYTDLHLASLQSVDVYVGRHGVAEYSRAPAAGSSAVDMAAALLALQTISEHSLMICRVVQSGLDSSQLWCSRLHSWLLSHIAAKSRGGGGFVVNPSAILLMYLLISTSQRSPHHALSNMLIICGNMLSMLQLINVLNLSGWL